MYYALFLLVHWAESILFGLAASLISPSSVSPAFIKDRQAFMGGKSSIGKADPVKVKASLLPSLHSLDSMLANSKYLMGTQTPQYADISFYFILDYMQTGQRSIPDLLPFPSSQQQQQPMFPNLLRWLDEVRAHLKGRTDALPKYREMDPAEAALHITSKGAQVAERAAGQKSAVSADDPLVKAGSLAHGDVVLVTPTDGGRVVS